MAQAQSAVTTGITVDKKNFQAQMVSYAMRVAGAVKAYASAEGNSTLQHKADLSDTTFTRARDDERDDIAQGVHDDANGVLAQLADYGVTAPTLTALQTRIDAYRLAIASPKMARGERSMHTELLRQEFARADMIVKDRIDGLIRQLEETNPQFVMSYQNARKITDTGSQSSGTPTPTPPTPPAPPAPPAP
ncbi:MAG: hypothetical protein H0X40_00155 [Chthoniobacterales bacterium]|nr:hypothetical protein [Chthoniobacterales bacterium]